MLIIGGLINTSRKAIREATETRNKQYIQKVAKHQEAAGANYLDVNCSTMVGQEIKCMEWLVNTIQEVTNLPLCINSLDENALRTGLQLAKSDNGKKMINSTTAEKKRYQVVVPLVKEFNTKIVAFCIDDAGIPETAEDRIRIASKLVEDIEKEGLAQDDIYLDPLIKPLNSNDKYGKAVLDAIWVIKKKYPVVHLACGLSNISYGLPNRAVLNRLFVVQTMTMGMDGYILNPTDKAMMGAVYAALALLGNDKYCTKYLKACREGLYA